MKIRHVSRNSVCRLAGVNIDNQGAAITACLQYHKYYTDILIIINNNTPNRHINTELPKVTCSACKVEIDRALDYGAVRTLEKTT
jgi:hypothetical protein